jgi:hypothetical protein
VQVGGLDVQREPPPAPVMANGGEQDLYPVFGEHAPQAAGVIVHLDQPDARQRDRPWAIIVADADGGRFAFGVFVAQPKRRDVCGLLLEARETDPLAFTLSGSRIRPRIQTLAQVDSGFLEHLLTHLTPPGQSGHQYLGVAVGIDGEHPPGVLGLLPRVERVDQVKPRPRHLNTGIGLASSERGFHEPKTLVEREPRCPGMPRQHFVLLDRGVQTVAECGVPTHHRSASHRPPTTR